MTPREKFERVFRNYGVEIEEYHANKFYDDLMSTYHDAASAEVEAYRDKMSTEGRPLDAAPLPTKQPVPCPHCGAKEYVGWMLWPHQLYNSYMPGGTGHYCFPCFCLIIANLISPSGEQPQ